MVTPPNFFLKFSSLKSLKITGTRLRAAASAAATGMSYLAASLAAPEYFGFDKFNLAHLNLDNGASAVLLFVPALAGAAVFVLPPHVKNVLGMLGLKLPARLAGSASSPAQAETQPVPALEPTLQPAASAPAAEQPALQAAPAPAVNMEETVSMIEDMVGKKVGEVVTDVTNMKNEVASFRNDITTLKDNIQNLTLSFESSLTDLKAFQAEMVNPLNFMRKYFETMDIKNLSDPIQPFSQVEFAPAAPAPAPPSAPAPAPKPAAEQKDHGDDDKKIDNMAARPPAEEQAPAPEQPPEAELQAAFRDILPQVEKQEDESQLVVKEEGGNGHANKIFQGSLTLGKLMSMVSILEKLLRDIGPDELEVLIEQYRQFGLKAEDEAAVYNVVGMLKEFDLSADEVMVRLYRLGQVMGIKDAQADLEYAKLQARMKSAKGMQVAARNDPFRREQPDG